jgi:hypothetical protein
LAKLTETAIRNLDDTISDLRFTERYRLTEIYGRKIGIFTAVNAIFTPLKGVG